MLLGEPSASAVTQQDLEPVCGSVSLELRVTGDEDAARVAVGNREYEFHGRWVEGLPWQRFGRYNHYVVIRDDGAILKLPAHAGELVPGSTEDLIAALHEFRHDRPRAPLTLELDPTNRCTSKDCGGRCFSHAYRKLAETAEIPRDVLMDVIRDFAAAGGRIVRFDGGGDPLTHRAVRSGDAVELAHSLALKSTILTSGDLLKHANLSRIAAADCYVRISLNAATEETRRRFHGNRVSLNDIFRAITELVDSLNRTQSSTPVGATFLLDVANYHEVVAAAKRARDCGIQHFSVRRVLGPEWLRPMFTLRQEGEVRDALATIQELAADEFRVFVPWRNLNEPDLDPAGGDFRVKRCWQSTFKTIVEPDPAGGFRAQLCGRYRGSGVGQRQQLPPLLTALEGGGWTDTWRNSFDDYFLTREALPSMCVSCIDRGFVLLLDRLMEFLGPRPREFQILHLDEV